MWLRAVQTATRPGTIAKTTKKKMRKRRKKRKKRTRVEERRVAPLPVPLPDHNEGAPGPSHLGTGETADLNWQEEAPSSNSGTWGSFKAANRLLRSGML